MPGLTGFVGHVAETRRADLVSALTRRLRHEDFYLTGSHTEAAAGLSVAWALLPGALGASQPYWNEDRSLGLFLFGEPMADPSLLTALRARGHAFADGDASFLVHLLEDRGVQGLTEVDGWFHGVLLDRRTGRATLFNDRLGLGRVYWHRAPEGFFFAGEAKALQAAFPALRQLDFRGVGEVVSCGCALENRTLFQGIRLLPPASAWELRPDGPAAERTYFEPSAWENQPRLGAAEFSDRLRAVFPDVVNKYLTARGPAAMSLTGGLDGRMIMAWSRAAAGSLPCYTFGSSYRLNTDAALARRVARACGQPHQVITVADEFLRDFPALADRAVEISDGLMDVTASVELYVNRIARRIAPVRMTGNYGSEVVRGNVAFRADYPSLPFLAPELLARVREAVDTYDAAARVNPITFIAFRQVPWHHFSRLSIEQSQLTLRSPFLDRKLVQLMYQAPEEAVASKVPSLQVVADGNPRLAAIPTDRGLLLRPRPVLSRLAHAYQETIFKAEYAFDYGMPDRLSRMPGVRLFEPLFLGRHKFYHFRVWYRDRLAAHVRQVLLDPRTLSRPYLRRSEVERTVADHLSGRRNATTQLHTLLWLETVQRRIVEGAA